MYQSIVTILEDIRQDIIDEYDRLGLRASGEFDRDSKVGRRGRKVYLSFPHGYIMEGGSKGGWPAENIIIKWMKDKGIQPRDWATGQFKSKTENNYRQAAFLISRKIYNIGTDIYIGKREGIDLDKIIGDALDYRGGYLADRIIKTLKI
jgi:hypothetical protein